MVVLDGKNENEFVLELSEDEYRIFLWYYKTKYTGDEIKGEDAQVNWACNEVLKEQLRRFENENAKGKNGKQRDKKETRTV